MVITEQFLEDYQGRTLPWTRPAGSPSALGTDRVLFGNGDNALEVAVGYAANSGQPRAEDLRALFKKRHANRPAPVLLVVGYHASDGQLAAAVVGTAGDPAPISGLPIDRVARVCTAALSEPDRHSAARTIDRLLAGLKDQLTPGLVNSGLFASHELRAGVPSRSDWTEARQTAMPLLSLRGLPLVQTLGYATAHRGSAALLLTHDGTSRALAVLLDETEVFDRPSPRFGAMSPIANGLTLAAQEGLPWLVVLRGSQIRLYPARPDVGVGRKGQAETYTELDLALLGEDDAAYLTLLFGPSALTPGGSAEQILAASENFAADLGKRLRERIYGDVVPGLALAVAARMRPQTDADLTETYHRTLLILFRLLFLAYAEDRGLLPYGRNPRYDRHAVKTLAKDFASDATIQFDEQATSLWDGMVSVWAAVDEGNSGWDVPAYNGGLLSRDATTNPSGAALAQLQLTDAEFGPVLRVLLVDVSEDGAQGPVDFRSLTVREFGTIYEGLLESNLSIALVDLGVDSAGSYLPATSSAEPVVCAGEVYIHNQSGQRRSTGSYFTKQFAVEHLLDTALEPAIDAHLEKVADLLRDGDDAGAAELFFDLRVADLAMGSAHFLVAAIDRIAAKFTAFLAEHTIPAVSDELTRLAQAARTALGAQAAHVELDPVALLRRQIARRCVYGLDLNLMAVELARLAIWIHTFVPGLPMSALDHNLVVGNSLTGIGTLDEVLDVFEPQRQPGQFSLFTEQIESALVTAKERLARAARTAEATKAEVREAARAHAKALDDAGDVKALLDAAIGVRLGIIPLPPGAETAIAAGKRAVVLEKVAELQAAHLPYLFPEVFLRPNPGFDVLLGNPPWDEVTVEEHKYWQRYYPGVVGLRPKARTARIKQLRADRPDLVVELQAEQARINDVRSVLISGPYPGLGTGDVDYYKAFAWRVWNALRQGGRFGMVAPRSLLNAAGSAEWREQTLAAGRIVSAVTLGNTGHWVFPEVDGRYTVVLITVGKDHAADDTAIRIAGPFHSLADYRTGISHPGLLPATSLTSWGNGAAFPLLPDTGSIEIFNKFRQHPRFDAPGGSWEFRSVAEFHATSDRSTFDTGGQQPDRWPVYTGATFNLWEPDAGDPTTWCDPAVVVTALQKKRQRQTRTSSSAFYGLPDAMVKDLETLPCMRPRIAYRQITNQTNSRTVLAALVPGHAILTNAAPYLLRRRGNLGDEAYLLGVLSSIPLDWYARRYVELNLNLHILNAFPIPRPGADDPWRTRIIHIAGRLAAVDGRYTDWATEVGVPLGAVIDQAGKADLIAELDALVALLYGLSRDDLQHVFTTFHRGWDYKPRLTAASVHYDRMVQRTGGWSMSPDAGPADFRPTFATNRPTSRETVADALNTLMHGMRTHLAIPPTVAIATAYFNPGGFRLLVNELAQVGPVRLLLGAEPEPGDQAQVRLLAAGRGRQADRTRVRRALEGHNRELATDRDLLGFTREADADARRLVDWLRGRAAADGAAPTVEVRRYTGGFLHGKAFIVSTALPHVMSGSSNFTYAGLARNRELNLGQFDPSTVTAVRDWFEELWAESEPYDLAGLYEQRWAAHLPWHVFLRMLWELYGAEVDEESAARSTSRLGLTGFQADGVWRARRILQRRHGVIVADEVGLGKTFIAGELIYDATVTRRQKVLVIAPATLRDSTWEPFLREKNLRADVVSFEQLVGDLGIAGRVDAALQHPDEYAMVVVDEAHALRNAATHRADAMRGLLTGQAPKDLLLMTATPVNNSLYDLYNLISYFLPNDAAFTDAGVPSLRAYFDRAMEMNPDDLSPEHLFDVIDQIAVRRTRRFVKHHYVGDKVVINGVEQEVRFPTPRVRRVDYDLDAALPGLFDMLTTALGAHVLEAQDDTDHSGAVLLDAPGEVLSLARYVPSRFRLGEGNTEQYEQQNAGLLRSALLKRFESSAYAFRRTVEKMISNHGDALREWSSSDTDDVDEFLASYTDGGDNVGTAADYDADQLRAAVEADRALLRRLYDATRLLPWDEDPKLVALTDALAQIAADATAEGIDEQQVRDKRKVIIFSYYADTVEHLETQVRAAVEHLDGLAVYRDRIATASGPDKRGRAQTLAGFAPRTAGGQHAEDLYDLLIATDVLSEGVNLQQARHIINYDLPWNPMRLVQRHGRIDRIGSEHNEVFLRCYFPDQHLEALLGLEERLQRKLKQAAAAVGVGQVLPGFTGSEVTFTEARDEIARLRREEATLFDEGGPSALSGEEYRRTLQRQLTHPTVRTTVTEMPWGAGTGFVRTGGQQPGIVFCARIADHPKPWFRYVPLSMELRPQIDEHTGEPIVVDDTLTCLAHADPGTPEVLSIFTGPNDAQPMYDAAFDAWAAAKRHIHAVWMWNADPANLTRPIPRVMRAAADLVRASGARLGDRQDDLIERLEAPYAARIQRAVRDVLTDDSLDDHAKPDRLLALANDLGLVRQAAPAPLPPIDDDDIHLVCWTAVTPNVDY